MFLFRKKKKRETMNYSLYRSTVIVTFFVTIVSTFV